MDKRKQTDNLMDFDIEIPDIVQQKANDAFKQIQNECKSNKTTVHSNQTNKISHAKQKKSRKWVKALVGVAACLAIVVASIGSSILIPDTPAPEGEKKNLLHRFSIQVMAAELDGTVQPVEVSEGQAIPIAMGGVSDGWSMGFPGNGCVSYSFSLPFRCVGEDISTITYDINKGDFFIEHPVEDGYVVSGFPASEGDLTDSFELEPGFAAEKYDSYTVNYDYQSADGVCVYLQDFLYDRPDIVELITYPEPDDLECTKRFVMAISKLMEDKIMTVTATFTDGTTEECHIVFGASLVYTELGVESERIEASYLTTIVCMVGKEDMNATTSVLSVVNEEDWWLDKRVVKVGDDVIVEKQKRIIGSEESEWSADWYADRETLHITEDSPLLGLHIKDSLNLDETSEYEEYRYVILSIPQTPEIVYGDQVNMYLGAHIPNNSK